MNVEKNTKKNVTGNESSINFSEQNSEKISINESYNQDNFLHEEVIQEVPKKKFLYGVRSLFAPMPGYGFSGMMKDFWKTAFTDSFAMLKKRTPLDSTTPFQTVLDNWGFSPENMNRTIRIMDVWVLLFSLIQIVSIILFVWGTQSNQPFFFCFQMFMVVLIPPIPLAVTLWKRDVLRTQVPQSFLHWFRHGFLGLAGIMLCVFWFAMPVGQTMAEETGGEVTPLSVPDMKVTNSEDLSSHLLYKLFGEVWTGNTQGVTKPVGDVSPDVSKIFLALFGGINTVALMFVSVFLVYIYAAGAVNGAQMGKWTDDQVFSSFWSPVRSAFAVAFCAPLPSGISLMQGLVFMAIAMSINFANDLKERVDMEIKDSMITNLVGEVVRAKKGVFAEIFNFSIQSAALTYIAKKDEKIGNIDVEPIMLPSNNRQNEEKNYTHFGGQSVIYKAIDGWTKNVTTPSLAIRWSDSTPGGNSLFLVSKEKKAIGEKTVIVAKKLYENLLKKMIDGNLIFNKEEIQKVYNEMFLEYANLIDASIDAATEKMKSKEAKDFIFQQIQGNAKFGWTTIGTYTFALAYVQGSLTSEINAMGTDIRFSPIKNMEHLAQTLISVKRDTSEIESMFESMKENESNRSRETSEMSEINSLGGLFSYSNNIFMRSNLGPLAFAKELKKTNPVTVLTSYGQNLLTTMAWTLTAAGAAFGIADSFSSTGGWLPGMGMIGGAMKGVVSVWSPLVTFTIGALLAFAATCTYILPAIPLIFWMRALFTWLILCIETLVGAPFWAATHALPEGKGFAGQHARRGYLMLLDVMIRPTLLVVGATISLLVICVVGFFMGTIFEMWATLTQKTFGFTFVGIFVMTLVLMYITYETCVYIFVTAVGHMPEQVIRWAGGQAGAVGTQDAIGQGKNMGGKASEATRGMGSNLGKVSQK